MSNACKGGTDHDPVNLSLNTMPNRLANHHPMCEVAVTILWRTGQRLLATPVGSKQRRRPNIPHPCPTYQVTKAPGAWALCHPHFSPKFKSQVPQYSHDDAITAPRDPWLALASSPLHHYRGGALHKQTPCQSWQ